MLVDKCVSNGACVNGTCVNVPTEEDAFGYICSCFPGYIGHDCDKRNYNFTSNLECTVVF